ncbi:MAG: GNAT family N-acetyltransferase [Roseinatronobacter sp.]
MIRVEGFVGGAIAPWLADLAALRIRVFRDWPYLYDGDLDYERRYLQVYRDTPGAIVVAAFDGARMVGASTGLPVLSADPEFPAAFAGTGLDLSRLFYCAESVLLPEYRGHGLGHRFFDLREGQARTLGATHVAFCAVQRAPDHPARPADYRPLDGFWRKRGYAPLPGVTARFPWRDLGDDHETDKTLQFWMRAL